MSYTYAIGDVHGMYDLMVKAFDFIHDDNVDGPKTIVTLGDYVDRGPDSALCVHHLRNFDKDPWAKLICLKGNHEDMMTRNTKSDINLWLYNGGTVTLQSYDQLGVGKDTIDSDRKWIEDLPTCYMDAHRVFVHAAYFDQNTVNSWEDLDHMRMWYRYGPGDDERVEVDGKWKYVVHGHTPLDGIPDIRKNRCNIDIGSCWTESLAVAKFDNDVEGPPVHVEIIT